MCGVLATISFAAWETRQFGVDFIRPVAECRESCFNSIGLYRLCCCCCFFCSAQDKIHIYKIGRPSMCTFFIFSCVFVHICINFCQVFRFFSTFESFFVRACLCTLFNLQLHKQSKGTGLVIGNVYISFQCVTLWWHLPFAGSNNAYTTYTEYVSIYPSISDLWFFSIPYSTVLIYIYLSIYLSTYLFCTFKHNAHAHTDSLTYFDSFSIVNTISFWPCRSISPSVCVSSAPKHRQK